jgi:hypothetical protein
MAIAVSTQRVLGRTLVSATLLDAQEATTEGEWIDVGGVYPLTIQIDGVDGDTVDVRYSNSPTMPPPEHFDLKAGDDIVADTGFSFEMPVRWLKVRVTAYNAGSITAKLFGVMG